MKGECTKFPAEDKAAEQNKRRHWRINQETGKNRTEKAKWARHTEQLHLNIVADDDDDV